MSHLPPEASFEERVADCFLAFRGSGLMLSPLDLQLVRDWARREVPFEVVARGIRRAVEQAAYDAADGETLRSIRACRRHVEEELTRHRARFARRPPVPQRHGDDPRDEASWPAAARSSEDASGAGRALEVEPRGEGAVLGDAPRRPPALPKDERLEAALRAARRVVERTPERAVNEVASLLLLRTLPFGRRAALESEARRRAEQSATSPYARRAARRFHRRLAVREALGLPTFW